MGRGGERQGRVGKLFSAVLWYSSITSCGCFHICQTVWIPLKISLHLLEKTSEHSLKTEKIARVLIRALAAKQHSRGLVFSKEGVCFCLFAPIMEIISMLILETLKNSEILLKRKEKKESPLTSSSKSPAPKRLAGALPAYPVASRRSLEVSLPQHHTCHLALTLCHTCLPGTLQVFSFIGLCAPGRA